MEGNGRASRHCERTHCAVRVTDSMRATGSLLSMARGPTTASIVGVGIRLGMACWAQITYFTGSKFERHARVT
jgi:hypothetical protein